MADYREFKCPYGDDFEGGDECDRCEQYEICMETPAADVVERSEYEKLKKENMDLKIKYDDAEKRFCNVMDRNAKLLSKINKARAEILKNVYEYSGSGNEVTQAYCDGFKVSLEIILRNMGE